MAVRVGEIEQAVEGLVNRGIGVSGLTNRMVGQMNIEELQDLGKAVAESDITLKNLQSKRESNVKSQQLLGMKSSSNYGGAGDANGAGGLMAGKPTVLGRVGQNGISVAVADGEGGYQVRTLDLGSYGRRELEAMGINLPSNLMSLADLSEGKSSMFALGQNKLYSGYSLGTELGRVQGADQRLIKSVLGGPLGIGVSKYDKKSGVKYKAGGGGSRRPATANATASARPSNPVDVVRQGLTPTASEKARVVDAGVNYVMSIQNSDPAAKDAYLMAMSMGKGFEAASAAIKKGVL